MFKNYIKTAFRSLLKNKGFTFINIAGLALGLVTCLLIIFYVIDELSYDKYNTQYERIYRVNTDVKYGGTITPFATTVPSISTALKNNFPEIQNTTRIARALGIHFQKGKESISEERVIYADADIFKIFSLPMIYGNPNTALTAPNSIVITENTAKKYFNTTDVIGKTLFLLNDSSLHKITGVIRNIPSQSHFTFDFCLSLQPTTDNSTSSLYFNTYILLKPNTDHKKLEAKFPDFIRTTFNTGTFSEASFEKSGNYFHISLMPLKDIHLYSNRTYELGANSDISNVYIFSAVALFILLIACVNFVNLSTARSANRAREVGVRKVLGSSRKNLIIQFITESFIVTFIAAIIALLIAWILLPLFNQLSGKQLHITFALLRQLIPSMIFTIVIVGLLAGSYPAFFLSSFNPVNVLKGKLSTGFKRSGLRGFLVIFQFSISIFLIIGTLVIYNQLKYIQNKDLGFNRNHVVVVKNVNLLDNPKILKQEIKQVPGVINATLTSFLPTNNSRWPNTISTPEKRGIQTELWQVDEDYLSTMGMQLVQGRNFSNRFLTDSSAMIINETAAKILGYKNMIADNVYNGKKKYHVIGIVKDFNFSSLRQNITPLVLVMDKDWRPSLSIRVNSNNLALIISQIKTKWEALAPNQQFDYSFMDEDFDAIYRTEQRVGKLFIIFTIFTLIIACLGLFGLAAYAAEQRNKEIGIRKVLGASLSTVIALLSKDFIKLVLISIAIATPLAWLAMHKWLEGFAYRQNIQWWVLVVTGLGAILIAFITISFQAVKAALVNPVESLRSE